MIQSKSRFFCALLAIFMLFSIIVPGSAIAADAGTAGDFSDDFNDNELSYLWSTQALTSYAFTEANGELKVDISKKDPFALFSYTFRASDLSTCPYVSLKIKSNTDLNLNAILVDLKGKTVGSTEYVAGYEVVASKHYTTLTFNFSDPGEVNLEKIRGVNFAFNHTSPRCNAEVYIDDVKIGKKAVPAPRMTNIPDQQTYTNAPEQVINFRGVGDGTNDTHKVTIQAKSSDTSLIPDPKVQFKSGDEAGKLTYKPTAGKTGTATITVTLSAAGSTEKKEVKFDILVEKNMAPKIEQVADHNAKAGALKKITLTGISDGNPNANQQLTITAKSSDTLILPDPKVEYTQGDSSAVLSYTPVSGKKGTASITITVKDNGGLDVGGVDTATTSFKANVFEDVNNDPTIDPIYPMSILEGNAEHAVALAGIGDGDLDSAQNVSIEVASSNTDLIPAPHLAYQPGDSTGKLSFAPVEGKIGKSTITLTLTDDGGKDNNNGNATKQITFDIEVRVRPSTGFQDDFIDGMTDEVWNKRTEDAHVSKEENGALKIEVDKTKTGNVWAGLWYEIPNELDFAGKPYINIRAKTDKPVEMRIYLWDYKGAYNTAGTISHNLTDEYADFFYDFTGKFLSGSGEKVDVTRIKYLLINFAPGASYKGNVFIDEIKVGDKSVKPNFIPAVTINSLPDCALAENSGEQLLQLAGISNGDGNTNNVSLAVESSDTSVIPAPVISGVTDGTASLKFTPSPDVTGSSTITVTATAEGSTTTTASFRVIIAKMDKSSAKTVTIDRSMRYQEMDGFGAFLGSGTANQATIDTVTPLVNDIGMSMARFGVVDTEFEPYNDNSNPNVINYDAFNYNALPMDFMKLLFEKSTIDKFIVTMWSPPAWMKQSKCQNAEVFAEDNVLEPHYYEEYAESLVDLVKAVKERTGIDLYALSLQNEPEFNEPDASSKVLWNEYVALLKVVGPRFEKEGLKTKIFMPEILPQQNHVGDYLNALNEDPEARKYVSIFSIHNYDADGIHVGGPGAETWAQIYEQAQEGSSKKTWMSETSGHANNWDGAMTLAGNIYTSLHYGNSSAWVFWSFNVTPGGEVFGLAVNGQPTSRYAVSKQYYKFISPGAIRVSADSSDKDVLSLAFDDAKNGKMSVLLINRSTEAKLVNIAGDKLPSSYQSYTTSNNRLCERGLDVKDGMILLPPNSVTTLYSEGELPAAPPQKNIPTPRPTPTPEPTSTPTPTPTKAPSSVTVKVNNNTIKLKNAPIVSGSTVLAPANELAAALKATYSYNSKTATVTIKKGSKTVSIKMNSTNGSVSGKPAKIPAGAKLNKKIPYVPLEFVVKNLGAKYSYDAKKKTVTIKY